jgi:hypothetical protein
MSSADEVCLARALFAWIVSRGVSPPRVASKFAFPFKLNETTRAFFERATALEGEPPPI